VYICRNSAEKVSAICSGSGDVVCGCGCGGSKRCVW